MKSLQIPKARFKPKTSPLRGAQASEAVAAQLTEPQALAAVFMDVFCDLFSTSPHTKRTCTFLLPFLEAFTSVSFLGKVGCLEPSPITRCLLPAPLCGLGRASQVGEHGRQDSASLRCLPVLRSGAQHFCLSAPHLQNGCNDPFPCNGRAGGFCALL